MTHLFVIFVADVHAVHFDDPVARFEARSLGGRAGVDFTDELSRPCLAGEQIEAETVKVRPLDDVAQTWGRSVGRDRAHCR